MADKNVVDSFLEEVNPKDTTLKEQDPFAGLEVQQEEKVEEPKEETPKAYHEDPKLRRYIEKEIAKATQHLTPREETKFREEVKEDGLAKAFLNVVGNDTPEKVALVETFKREMESLREEARSAKEELQAERQADYEAEGELAEGFEAVEDTFNVNFSDKRLRNSFIDFIERVAPKDENGDIKEYPDFVETFRTYQELNKRPNNRAKELASRSMTRSSEASQAPMPADTSWKGVEKFFSTLKG